MKLSIKVIFVGVICSDIEVDQSGVKLPPSHVYEFLSPLWRETIQQYLGRMRSQRFIITAV